MKLIIFLIAFTFTLKAPEYKSIAICQSEAIRPYEAIWLATCKVESSNNPFAVGDKHLKEYSYGLVQIRNSHLSDYYNKTGIRYSEQDMLDPAKSKAVFMYYCNPDPETTARTWNGGATGMSKESTLKYWELIQAQL